MVNNDNLHFPNETLKSMMELYADLVNLFVGDQTQDRPQAGGSTQDILQSELTEKMAQGLNTLSVND